VRLSVPYMALVAEPHFMRRAALGLPFVTKICGIGELLSGQDSHDLLFLLCRLFDPLIKFIAGGVLYLSLFEHRGL